MAINWDKPIQFVNGQPCRLIDTLKEGQSGNFGPDFRRIVERIGVEGMTAIWWYKEDGKSNWPGYNIMNVYDPAMAETEEEYDEYAKDCGIRL